LNQQNNICRLYLSVMMPSGAIGWGYTCWRVCAGQEDGAVEMIKFKEGMERC